MSSLYADSAVYDERRVGASLGFSPRAVGLFVTYETGANRYTAPTRPARRLVGEAERRREDAAGHHPRRPSGSFLTIGIQAEQSEYTSNIPGFDRSVFRIGTTIGFGTGGGIDILR